MSQADSAENSGCKCSSMQHTDLLNTMGDIGVNSSKKRDSQGFRFYSLPPDR